MAAPYLRDRKLEVANSDMQDSAFVVVRDTRSIYVVTDNDKDSRMSAQIQGMLAGFLSTLSRIQSHNAK
jgi:hypothetical protein